MKTRSEIKKEYKARKQIRGIFQIRNKGSGKVFIGKSNHVDSILNRHKAELKMGSHRNRALQSDYNNLGIEHFDFEILKTLDDIDKPESAYEDELKELERLVLEKCQLSSDNFYH